jgi:hypothetical protein
MQARVSYINKSDFLLAYYTACIEALTLHTICSKFAATGLVLYDLERVLLKLNT